MSAVLLVGTGQVAIRAARQLVDTPGLTRLWIASSHPDRARELARSMGELADVIDTKGTRIPPDARAVVIAIGSDPALAWARASVRARTPVVTIVDGVDCLALDVPARAAEVAVVFGCGVVPGLGDVLARHAADALDAVDEVHVARTGVAGVGCAESLARARRERPREWRSGEWVTPRQPGPQLVWFPDPIGVRECELVAAGVHSVTRTVPEAGYVTVRFAAPPPRRFGWFRRRSALDAGWGAARVEVWGWRGGARETVVYGVIDRTAVAAGTALAVTGARLAGLLGDVALRTEPVGARALGEVIEPTSFLAELARRGVKAAAFEGADAT